MTLTLEDIRVTFGGTAALDGVSLVMQPGERLAVLGPSGSGKSTLLRVIAGLAPPTSGRVLWDGTDLADVPVHLRGFGLMFQDYALFPHRDVAGNVAFGLETRGIPKPQRAARVSEVLTLVGLPGYGHRRIDQLSGGEQQRVALARALAPTPKLLMLDEPLGALDRSLRTRLLDELALLFTQLGLPIIYVTHDQEEALAVGDRVAVLNHGRLEALMAARDLWLTPPNEFVARFLGMNNVVPMNNVGSMNPTVETPWGTLDATDVPANATRVLIRPDALTLDPDGSLSGVVNAVAFRGESTTLLVRPAAAPDGPNLEARIPSTAGDPPVVGARVSFTVDPSGVLFLP
jgi:thiamine transport system ATP-binding protein